jgi:urease accessory protein
MLSSTLLHLLWLASPALPVGAFSYSEGLEAAIDADTVHDEASAATWLAHQLTLTQARAEMPAVAHAMAAWQAQDTQAVVAINDWLLATRESSELRAQSLQMGQSLLAWLRNGTHASDPRLNTPWDEGPTWPVAFALAAVQAQAEPSQAFTTHALTAHAFGWCENMVQAAIKAVPLGQLAAQRILATLVAQVPAAVAQALEVQPHQRQSFAPMLAILSAQHETQYTRIFRS